MSSYVIDRKLILEKLLLIVQKYRKNNIYNSRSTNIKFNLKIKRLNQNDLMKFIT